jgi:hypothetical protein
VLQPQASLIGLLGAHGQHGLSVRLHVEKARKFDSKSEIVSMGLWEKQEIVQIWGMFN